MDEAAAVNDAGEIAQVEHVVRLGRRRQQRPQRPAVNLQRPGDDGRDETEYVGRETAFLSRAIDLSTFILNPAPSDSVAD